MSLALIQGEVAASTGAERHERMAYRKWVADPDVGHAGRDD
jgi:hypothetical protein